MRAADAAHSFLLAPSRRTPGTGRGESPRGRAAGLGPSRLTSHFPPPRAWRIFEGSRRGPDGAQRSAADATGQDRGQAPSLTWRPLRRPDLPEERPMTWLLKLAAPGRAVDRAGPFLSDRECPGRLSLPRQEPRGRDPRRPQARAQGRADRREAPERVHPRSAREGHQGPDRPGEVQEPGPAQAHQEPGHRPEAAQGPGEPPVARPGRQRDQGHRAPGEPRRGCSTSSSRTTRSRS